jgi:hypothetical protein
MPRQEILGIFDKGFHSFNALDILLVIHIYEPKERDKFSFGGNPQQIAAHQETVVD